MFKRLCAALAAVFVLSPAFAAGTIPFSLSQQLDNFGKPLAGCQFYTIQAGTTSTPQNAYQDSALTIVLPNPQTCNAAGRLPQMFLADGTIKVRLTDKNGVTILNVDNIQVVGASSGSGGGGTVDPTTILATGDLKVTYGTGVISGFVRANGRTIGSATSGASERANLDCLALFQYLWGADANLAVSTGRGVSAAADWAANKTIALPDWRGRALAGLDDMGNSAASRLTSTYFGTSATVLGAAGGSESQLLALAQLPTGITSANAAQAISFGGNLARSSGSSVNNSAAAISGSGTNLPVSSSTWDGPSGVTVSISATSNNTSGIAHPIASPMMLATIYLKL